ncbi:hypothetical protein [Massilia sp. PWRC2]|uniref:hypothetical protein n=1 Tax=Massilia sp. PWRC2 TaxID=2804626 RepID=UPI003CFAA519
MTAPATNPNFRHCDRAPYELGHLLLKLQPASFAAERSEAALAEHPRDAVAAVLQHAGNANDTLMHGIEALGHVLFVAAENEDCGLDMRAVRNLGTLLSHLAVEAQFLQELDWKLTQDLERLDRTPAL